MLVMDREAETIMAERFGKDAVIALATVADGVPHVRYVDAYYQAGAFYIVTDSRSQKMAQIRQNPRVAVAGEWFTGHGHAEDLGPFGQGGKQGYRKHAAAGIRLLAPKRPHGSFRGGNAYPARHPAGRPAAVPWNEICSGRQMK